MSSAVPPCLEPSKWLPLERTGPMLRADTPFPLTEEHPGDAYHARLRFGPRLPDPFRIHRAPGSHRLPARLTRCSDAYSFRSQPIMYELDPMLALRFPDVKRGAAVSPETALA